TLGCRSQESRQDELGPCRQRGTVRLRLRGREPLTQPAPPGLRSLESPTTDQAESQPRRVPKREEDIGHLVVHTERAERLASGELPYPRPSNARTPLVRLPSRSGCLDLVATEDHECIAQHPPVVLTHVGSVDSVTGQDVSHSDNRPAARNSQP